MYSNFGFVLLFLISWLFCPPGGLTGAGARITGAFGDVFAKLTFDDDFIEQRQQTKVKPPKIGWKLGNFAKVGGVDIRCEY